MAVGLEVVPMKPCRRIALLLFALVSTVRADRLERAPRVRAWAAAGPSGGEVTYRIGGTVRDASGAWELPFPVSELEWPMEVVGLRAGLSVDTRSRWEPHAAYGVSLTDEAGTMKDSDWGDATDASVLTVYSESDATLEAWEAEAGLRCWFGRREEALPRWALGIGYRHQDLAWETTGGVQEYPAEPWLGVDVIEGVGVTYDVAVRMPYVEGAFRWEDDALRFDLRAGYAPWLEVEDEDDHVARTIRSRTDAEGDGWFAEGSMRRKLRGGLALLAEAWVMGWRAEGVSENTVYGFGDPDLEPGQAWEIDEQIESTQFGARLGLEAAF